MKNSIADLIANVIESYKAEHPNIAGPAYLYIEEGRDVLFSKEVMSINPYSRQHTGNTLGLVNSLKKYEQSDEVHISEGAYACARYNNLIIAAGSQNEENSEAIVDFFCERLRQPA